MFFPSLPVASQSAVVTTTGTGNASLDVVPGELLNVSRKSNISNISHILPLELQGEIQDESDDFKDLVNEELKNLELAEEMEKHREWEKAKAKLLWHKNRKKKRLMLRLNIKNKNF